MTRVYRRFMIGLIVFALLVRSAPAEEFVNPFKKDRTDEAADRAVKFLISQQKPDGSISDNSASTAMTALAIMAMRP